MELRGQLKMQGDAPHECFTLRYQKGANQVENYYSCKDCKVTWVSTPSSSSSSSSLMMRILMVMSMAQVCEACAKECHKGHTVAYYMPNHKPTWACCYCAKKSACKIPNAKTKRG